MLAKKGICHKDIKPDKILYFEDTACSVDGLAIRLKFGDFGIAEEK
jgi:serine/threonine protein kinase